MEIGKGVNMFLRKTIQTLALTGVLLAAGVANADPGRAVPGDYDADGRTDIVVVRGIGGFYYWFLRTADGVEFPGLLFGLAGSPLPFTDTIMAGDYDGDGDYGVGVVREEATGLLNWYYLNNETPMTVQWGLEGDTPLIGYFDADAAHDMVVARNIGGFLYWFIRLSSGGTVGEASLLQLGLSSATPYVGDLNGDGIDEVVVAQEEGNDILWYGKTVNGTLIGPIAWGLKGDTTLPPIDVNNDGVDDLVVVRALNGTHLTAIIRVGNQNGEAVETRMVENFGLKADKPYMGFFGGATEASAAVFRAESGIATHFVMLGTFQAVVNFGLSQDTLVTPQGKALGASGSALAEVCPQIVPVYQGFLWKPASDHSGQPRVGKPLIIVTRNKPSGTCLRIFATNGEQVSRLGLYEYNGIYGGTWYSGWGCGDGKYSYEMADTAEALAGSPNIYVEKGDGTCVGPIHPEYRTGAR